jgi:N-acetylglucosamine-6-phosphate deacetylase
VNRLNNTPASIYSRGGWLRGYVLEQDGVISGIDGSSVSGKPKGPYIVPGFVDLHVHGGNGAEVMGGETGIRATAAYHAKHGTAAICATTLTAPLDEIEGALHAIGQVEGRPGVGEAEVIGAHIEGPFVNPAKLGGQPPFAISPRIDLVDQWVRLCSVRIVTMAPELPDAESVVRHLARQGVRVQVGHSLADASTLDAAAGWGIAGFSHLFNAVNGMSSRLPGVSGWALSRAEWAELICDLEHVHPDMLRTAVRSISKPYFISDCCSAGGRPDGSYRLGQNAVEKRGKRVCLPGTDQLAASVLTGADAFRNLLSIGLPLETAVVMTSSRPAEYLGLNRYGDIVGGKTASVVAFDDEFNLETVWIRGTQVEGLQ